MQHILVCKVCQVYTLRDVCNKCGMRTVVSKPAKYSPEDPYAAYRRKAKELMEA